MKCPKCKLVEMQRTDTINNQDVYKCKKCNYTIRKELKTEKEG